MKKLQIPQKRVYKKFYVHEIAAVNLSKIYFLKNAKKTCKPSNCDLNRDWNRFKYHPMYQYAPTLTSCTISRSTNTRDLKFSLEMVLRKMKMCKTPGWPLSGPHFARRCVNYTIITYLMIYKCSSLQIFTRSTSQ